ncbi:uncharacterized protein NFIA_059880 [Aspergillus fischeri NRRL 181]|uniref:Uncharacterized protein n=1 Tax=Neosartorya fischeri (strain ATCC 1020 / DSM 3700 / CBS 544.65 / FGSC A1164 / JCM 1740 / NRRL 181 / WB 181) TaxID=331117 RepID=A1DPB2_NEOFI|nr:uncharacterized protein NFIA_059880 [Aspergillus fischeri NRRL 181]EAW16633.1 hypothetical protein NFIA_059880 [Aspergillus fischeri NRRL 181]
MRFQISLLTLIYVALFGSLSHAFIGPTCMKISDALGDRPAEVYKLFYKEVCQEGCQPDITHIDRWARQNVIKPLVAETTKKLGVPQQRKTIENLVQAVVQATKQDCVKKLGSSHLCQSPEKLEAFGQCLKGSLTTVLMSRVGELGPLLTEPMCQKAYDYLRKHDLWVEVIPRYFKKYAKLFKNKWYKAI